MNALPCGERAADAELLNLFAHWREIRRRAAERGAADVDIDDLVDEELAATRRIVALPARSAAGLAAKARMLKELLIESVPLEDWPSIEMNPAEGRDDVAVVSVSLVADIERLAGGVVS